MEKKTAVELAEDQKSISIARFFEKNRQMLGFGSPARALVTAIKEAVDNSLDGCEDANILPSINVNVRKTNREKVYKLIVEDNGPGIVKEQIPPIFGKFLYGSKFGKRVQSRGQQGVGISAVVLYSQITTGNPTIIESVTQNQENRFKIGIDTEKNQPQIVSKGGTQEKTTRGLRIEVDIEAGMRSRNKVLDYLHWTSIANPHTTLRYTDYKDEIIHERNVDELPEKPKEIKPHPHGIELGDLKKLIENTDTRKVVSFLQNEFVSVGRKTAKKIEKELKENIDDNKQGKAKDGSFLIRQLNPDNNELKRKLLEAMRSVDVQSPPTGCLSPIGEDRLNIAMGNLDPEFHSVVTRSPKAYSGEPFVVEAGLAYGGKNIENFQLMRFANRVPLVYNRGGCVTTKVMKDINWTNYGFDPKEENMRFFLHVASTNVPFTSESKDAIDDVKEIRKECELALRKICRDLKNYQSRKRKRKKKQQKEKKLEELYEIIAENAANAANMEKPDSKKALREVL